MNRRDNEQQAPLQVDARRLIRVLLINVCFLCLVCSFTLSTSSAGCSARVVAVETTRAERLAVFDDVWETIRERYYDPELHGVDWDALRAELRPLATEASDESELYAVLRRLTASLRDAHTRVYTPEERSRWEHPLFITVGLSLREIAGQIIIARVEHGSEAQRAGVRAGDCVQRVDGKAASVLLAGRLSEGAGASTERAARLQALSHLFEGERGSLVELVLTSREGRAPKTIRLHRHLIVREPALRIQQVDGCAVIYFNSFTQEIVTELTRTLRGKLGRARGIILDLRENGGGEAEAMTDLASAFLPTGTALGLFTNRRGEIVSAPQTRRTMLLAADAITSFQGRVVVLTGTRTASASEIFVAALKEQKRAQIIGEQTCGCVLGIRARHPLPDGGALDLSETDYHTASGLRLEGAGVLPDQTITPSLEDFRARRDAALKQAIALLKTAR